MKKSTLVALISIIIALALIIVALVIDKPEKVIKEEIEEIQMPELKSEVTVKTYPVDEYYAEQLLNMQTTQEINYTVDEYMKAWDAEFKNVVKLLKDELKYDEDKKYLDEYYIKYVELATNMAEIEHLKWVDVNEKPEDRFSGTGSTSAEIMQMVKIYKQGALNLISYYEEGLEHNRTYKFVFSK